MQLCAPSRVCSYSPSHAGELTSFNVAQECICECNGTSTGIFCRGANPMREFLAVASTEPGTQGWKMSKWFVGTGGPLRTTAHFGSTCVLVFAYCVYAWHHLTCQRCWDTGRAATTAQLARYRIRVLRGCHQHLSIVRAPTVLTRWVALVAPQATDLARCSGGIRQSAAATRMRVSTDPARKTRPAPGSA